MRTCFRIHITAPLPAFGRRLSSSLLTFTPPQTMAKQPLPHPLDGVTPEPYDEVFKVRPNAVFTRRS